MGIQGDGVNVKYSKLVPLLEQDAKDAAQVQQDKILSQMWGKKQFETAAIARKKRSEITLRVEQ